ncbi:MAG: hypothetical protein R2821_07000 [Flavobacteriaceae bacterium]
MKTIEIIDTKNLLELWFPEIKPFGMNVVIPMKSLLKSHVYGIGSYRY